MSADLADLIDGVPGRFVPDALRGQPVEAEHLTRYWWAAGLVERRRVLDAGCGLGYGTAVLADHAASVTGIDIAEDVVAAAAVIAPAAVRFDVGDVRALPYGDGEFDVIACFELIEHVKEQEVVLAELARVLAPGGVLLISSPNRRLSEGTDPHHVRELVPEELVQMLRAHWPNTRLIQQHDFAATAILPVDASITPPAPFDPPIGVRTLAVKPAGEERYTIGLASTEPLPVVDSLVTLASSVEVRQWVERFEAQESTLHELRTCLDAAERRDADRRLALARLAEAEQELAELPSLRRELSELRDQYLELAAVAERAERAEQTLRDVMDSPSWRLTEPLRRAKRLARPS